MISTRSRVKWSTLLPVLGAVYITGFISCKENNIPVLEITGELKNMEKLSDEYPALFYEDSISLYLYEVPFSSESQPVLLDSVRLGKGDGKFQLKAQAAKEGLFDVMIGKGPMIPLVNDNSIQLEVDLTDKENFYRVSGSKASQALRNFIFGYSEKSSAAADRFNILDSLKMTGAHDTLVIAATEEKNNALESLNQYTEDFVSGAENPLVSAFALGMASRTFSQDEYGTLLDKTISKFPTDANLQYLKNQLTNAQQIEAQTHGAASWTGKPAPEMSMPDVNGKEVSIASFKGKYVLVDFWASWCGPCRMENPNVVRAYNHFKNRNFTVLGVSLDKDRDKWLEAIEKDKLTWTHISDLAFWNSKSVDIFRFQGIPYNVLIDPDGIIIAESLRGADLMNTLQEVLK